MTVFFSLDGWQSRYVRGSGKRSELCDNDDAVLDTVEHETAASRVEIVDTHDHLANQFVKVKIMAVSNELRSKVKLTIDVLDFVVHLPQKFGKNEEDDSNGVETATAIIGFTVDVVSVAIDEIFKHHVR